MLQGETKLFKTRTIRAMMMWTLAFVLIASPLFAGTARADGGLNLSTPYPGVTVSPGEDITFALSIENESATPQNVALSVDTLPEGWKAYFEGDGNPVSRVYAKDGETVNVNFVIIAPDSTSENNSIVVKAEGENGAVDTLQLDVTINEEEFTKGKLTAPYQEQQGSSTTIFDYSISLTNGSSKAQSYSLSAVAPKGWQVSFYTSDGLQIASLNIEGNRSQTITVKADAPVDVVAGTYSIPVSAVSAKETLGVDLTAVITGTYAMTLSTPTGLISVDAYAGKTSTVTLTVNNTGTADLNNIALTATSVPTDWSVDFDTKEIATLAAGQSVQVNANIKAASDAINGDYVVSINAQTSEASSKLDMRVAVKTSTVWGIVGVVIVAAVVAALVFIFKKYGRR